MSKSIQKAVQKKIKKIFVCPPLIVVHPPLYNNRSQHSHLNIRQSHSIKKPQIYRGVCPKLWIGLNGPLSTLP